MRTLGEVNYLEKYDVIIVGGGPGGATAAYNLAKAGISVCIIDKNAFPRDKVCGGGLCAHIRKFDYVDDIFFKTVSTSAVVYSPSQKHIIDYSPGKDLIYQVNRLDFDDHLIMHAKAQGAVVFEKQKVETIERIKGGIIVETKNMKFKGKVAIGAGGVFCPLSKFVGVTKNSSAFCMVEEIPLSAKEIVDRYTEERKSVLFFLENITGGYGWIFPKKESVNIGVGTYSNIMKEHGALKAYHSYHKTLKQLGYLPENHEPQNIKGAMLPFGGIRDKIVIDNVLLVGDSAGFVSPISGEGIYYAMDSGRIAAEVIIDSMRDDDFREAKLKKYYDICLNEWGEDIQLLNKYHKLLVNNSERSLRYAEHDEDFLDLIGGLMLMEEKPTEVKYELIKKMISCFFRIDILKVKN